MGESVVERPTIENKMGESVHSAATLEVSVSFGRFENDSLSWEKWSSFSPNKYLEEVGKCSTPGSVAQKKAYFEAHYKKIAARKAEQQSEQEKSMAVSVPSSSSDEQEQKDLVKNEPATNGDLHLTIHEKPSQDVNSELSRADEIQITTSENGKLDQDNEIAVNSQGSTIEETKEELDGTSANLESGIDKEETEEDLISIQADPDSSVREGSIEVLEESAKDNPPQRTEQSPKVDEAKKAVADRSKSQKLSARYSTKKMTPRKKEQTTLAAERKKVTSPAIRSSLAASPATKSSSSAAKLSHLSTPRLSKSTMTPVSQSSVKKVNGSSSAKSKITSGGYRKSGPTSLHMSLSLDPGNSGASFTTTRKSLIMEQMGDKDIVRRAFKTFQNRINGLRSSTDGLFGGQQQVSYKGSEQKVTNASTPQKENEGRRKTAEKINQRSHPGNRSHTVSMGLHKGLVADKKSTIAPSASLRNDARAEKPKEEKANMRGAGRTELGAKKKEEKEAEMKNVRRAINSTSSSLPAFNRGKLISKNPLEKEDKSKTHNQLTSKR